MEEVIRVRLPEKDEVIGVVIQLLGFAKMRVKCLDGVERICRVPGRLSRKLWIKEGNYVLVKPWSIQKDRGDIIYKYSKTEVMWLKEKGYLSD